MFLTTASGCLSVTTSRFMWTVRPMTSDGVIVYVSDAFSTRYNVVAQYDIALANLMGYARLAPPLVFSAAMPSGTPSLAICNAWETFVESVDTSPGSYLSVTISSSLGTTFVCNSQTEIDQIAVFTRTCRGGSCGSVSCGGVVWSFGGSCVAPGSPTACVLDGDDLVVTVDSSAQTTCECGAYLLQIRAHIANSNWGGQGASCGQPAQTLSMSFDAPVAPAGFSGCPSNVVTNVAPSTCSSVVNYATPTSDVCAVSQTAGLPSGSTFSVGTTTNTFTSGDSSCSFTVTVQDNESPTITCPANINVNSDSGACGAAVTYAVSSSDNCPGQTVSQTAGLPSGSTFTAGTTTNSFQVQDASGATATCSFTVTVTDNEIPTILCPANINVNSDSGICGAVVTYAVSSSDNCPGQTVSQTAGLPSGSTFTAGTTTTNSFQVQDASGATATCSFTVTVTDNEIPTISCPANINVNSDSGICGAVVTYAVSSSDNCPGQTVSQTAGLPSGSTFGAGTTTTNSFQVQDTNGATATCSFTVTVTDNEIPTITCPANINVNSPTGACSAAVTYAVSSSDNCPGQTVSQTAGLPSGSSFTVGTTTNSFQVQDTNGATATCSFTVTVTDNESPTISCPANINVNSDSGACGAVVTYAVSSGDNCPGQTVSQTAGLSSGSTFTVGTTTNSFQVQDTNGATATCSFTVTVADSESPTITCPANINVNSDSGVCGAVVTYAVSSSDNCPGQTIFQMAGLPSGSTFNVGTTTNSFQVQDAGGIAASCSFTVTVTDTESPTVSCPANINVNSASGTCGATVTYAVSSNDNCPGQTVSQTAGLPSGSTFTVGTMTNSFQVQDAAGITSTCSFTVTVTDNESPVISCPANMEVVANQPYGFSPATATDNCPGVSVTQTCPSPPCPSPTDSSPIPIVETIEFTATDASGQTAVCSFSITVVGGLPVAFNMYIPVAIEWAPSILPSDTTLHLELSDIAVQFVSESVPNAAMLNFVGISQTQPAAYSVNLVGDQSGSILYMGDVLLCASPFVNIPAGCANQ